MIVDAHYHTPWIFGEGSAIVSTAERYYRQFGPGSRSGMQQVNLTLEDIKRGFQGLAPDPDGEKLLERMRRAGIDVTVVCVVDNLARHPTDDDILAANRECAEFARRSGGRVIALAGTDPRRKEAPQIYRRCVEEYGMRGLKFHPMQGFDPNGEEAYAVLAVAERLGTPVLVHTGMMATSHERKPAASKYGRVSRLDEVAQSFPGLKVIAAHVGRFEWREWASVAEARPNLYGDISNWQPFAVASYERFCLCLREMLDIAGTDSLLFASDGPGFEAVVPNGQILQILRDLPQKAPPGIRFTAEEVAAILGGNAQNVFGLRD